MVNQAMGTRSFVLALPFKLSVHIQVVPIFLHGLRNSLLFPENDALLRTTHCPRFFIFLSLTTIKSAGALDGHNYHVLSQ